MTTSYQEHKIEEIFAHFVRGYALPDGKRLADYVTTYDPRTGTVVIKLSLVDKQDVPVPA